MPWFKVDDSFHSHPKVLATDADALGLWVVAGAWSSSNLTDGFVPDHVLTRLLPDSTQLARKLVSAGLWKRIKGGHRFHDWTDFQPTAESVRSVREKRAEAGRIGGVASGRTRSKPGSKTEALASRTVEPPTRPDPILGGALGDPPTPRAGEAPSPRCPEHINTENPPYCGRCADARRARAQWEVAEALRIRSAPKCRSHRGQLAGNCALCRSEAVGSA